MRYSFRAAGVCLSLAMLALCLQAATPQILSLSPSSGSGLTQTFTLTASDTDGAADIASMNLLINTSLNGSGGCWIYYDHTGQQVSVYSDQGTWNGVQQNSQCSVQLASHSDSGNTVAAAISVTFSGAWTGQRTLWATATDHESSSANYQQLGTFDVVNSGPPQDFSVSMTPSSQSTTPGHTVQYSFTLTSINGFSGSVEMNATADPSTGVTLGTSAGALPNSFFVPAGGTVSGTLNAATTDSTPPATITITSTFQFSNLQHSASVQLALLAAAAPTITVAPVSGSGATQTFTISLTDQGGYASISALNFLINSSFSGANGCWFYLAPLQGSGIYPTGVLTMANDDATNWSATTYVYSTDNSPTPIHNSQCSVFGGPTTISGNGNTLTFTLTLTFSPGFNGQKFIYVRAADTSSQETGYQQEAAWTVSGTSSAPDFSVGVSPGSVNITGQDTVRYSLAVTANNGYTGTVNLSVSGLPPNSTADPISPIMAGETTSVAIHTTGSTPTGSYTLVITGTDGTLTRTSNAVLNVQGAAVPTVSASPTSGSGASQTFTFTAAGQGGTSDPTYLNVLFNTAVNGQNGCWMYFDGNFVSLASDDGTIWTRVGSSASNSQCTITGVTANHDVQDSIGFSAQISFSSTFTGAKNVYVHSVNGQGGDTGYQLQGTWTP